MRPSLKPVHAKPGRPRDEALAAWRRSDIVRHAIREFAQRGYSGADLDVIARHAKCSKGTLYNYFDSKGALFGASVDHVMYGMVEAIGTAEGGEPAEQLYHIVHGFLRYFADHPHYVELLVQERSDFRDREGSTYFRYRAMKRQRWLWQFSEWVKQGQMRPIPPEQALDFLGNVLYGAMFLNHFRGRRVDPARQAAELVQVLSGGLLPGPAPAAKRTVSRKRRSAAK